MATKAKKRKKSDTGEDLICYLCQDYVANLDHVPSRCPRAICKLCKESGHVKKDCPKLKESGAASEAEAVIVPELEEPLCREVKPDALFDDVKPGTSRDISESHTPDIGKDVKIENPCKLEQDLDLVINDDFFNICHEVKSEPSDIDEDPHGIKYDINVKQEVPCRRDCFKPESLKPCARCQVFPLHNEGSRQSWPEIPVGSCVSFIFLIDCPKPLDEKGMISILRAKADPAVEVIEAVSPLMSGNQISVTFKILQTEQSYLTHDYLSGLAFCRYIPPRNLDKEELLVYHPSAQEIIVSPMAICSVILRFRSKTSFFEGDTISINRLQTANQFKIYGSTFATSKKRKFLTVTVQVNNQHKDKALKLVHNEVIGTVKAADDIVDLTGSEDSSTADPPISPGAFFLCEIKKNSVIKISVTFPTGITKVYYPLPLNMEQSILGTSKTDHRITETLSDDQKKLLEKLSSPSSRVLSWFSNPGANASSFWNQC